MSWGGLRDKWKKKMLVAEMAAGPCFAPAEVRASLLQPQGEKRGDWLKNLQASKTGFFLNCLTEPLVFASPAVALRVRRVSSCSAQPLRCPVCPGPKALE